MALFQPTRGNVSRLILPLVLVCTLFCTSGTPVAPMDLDTLESPDLVVQFERPLSNAASDVMRSYPAVKEELEKTLGWPLDFRPFIFLIKDGSRFREITGNDMVVAFALPREHFIAIDYSKMGVHPFTLHTTLKHELCHLMLGSRIKARLPRWLDEGVAQWATGGLSEMITGRTGSYLSGAVASQRLISLDDLRVGFPEDRQSLALAYEESRSFVEYISKRFGKAKIPEILRSMGNGEPLEDAVQGVLAVPLPQLEADWRRNLTRGTHWFLLVADNIYEILFFLAALITAYASVVLVIRRRGRAKARVDENEEEEDEEDE